MQTLLIAGTLNRNAWESAAKPKIMKQINYVGFKTEAFTVIERREKSKWLVRCNKCGKEYVKTISEVKKYQTAGCLSCTPRFANSKSNDWHLYIHYKGHARDKNRKFELSYDEFKKLVHDNCFYCGSEPQIQHQLLKYSKNSIPQPLNGVDRIDSSKGYTIDNCVTCCSICNQMKSNIDQNLFLSQIEKIHNNRNVQRLSWEGVDSSESKWSEPERVMI